uniref:ATPase subunit 8 n=1 Tax=Clavelina lepadiformis TaxID=159417 RepID=D0Z5R2_CLALP|nr:ATPase subunit 8 [Clavelina lepadiformis]
MPHMNMYTFFFLEFFGGVMVLGLFLMMN